MNKTLLQQLYDGEVYPAEKISPKDPKYKEISLALADERAYFFEILGESDNQRFKALDEMYFEMSTIYSFENFAYGFRLGVSLLIEALGESELAKKTE